MITLKVIDSIQKTINSIPKDHSGVIRINVPKGVYKERVVISVPHIIIQGEGMDETVITEKYRATETFADGEKRGTFRSYTMYVDAEDVTIRDLTIENSSGYRKDAGQALALYGDGDHLLVENCRIKSRQDTLFIGPLPEKELKAGGFKGPGEEKERVELRQRFRNCQIIGDVDFIFGSGAGYFEGCEMKSITEPGYLKEFEDGEKDCLGYVCAPSTYENQTFGFVFKDCKFTGEVPEKSVYLARPWRDFGKCIYINCEMGAHIKPEGFHDWNKDNARKNCCFAEYQSLGKGAEGPRAGWAKSLSEKEVSIYSKEAFEQHWNNS